MTDSFWSWTLADFRDRIASANPQPSGVPVAAVSAAFGLGLVLMCLEITHPGAASEDVAAGRQLLERLSAHADRDATAYSDFMAAMALPKGTAEELALRRRRMQETLAAATKSPLAAARDIVAALDLAARTAESCKVAILSDLAAGVDLLAASLSAMLRTADVNLAEISDAVVQEGFRAERSRLATLGESHVRKMFSSPTGSFP
ncbi:MAG TPA: cyclodeaminase/cyclohydrolase family protein [Thermoanaerobaculia bacterium]|jgi:formiminotetrahydrofolate cyclodeaminase